MKKPNHQVQSLYKLNEFECHCLSDYGSCLSPDIGKQCKLLQKRKRLILSLDKTTLSKIETGQSEITVSRIEKIANALKVDYNLLVTSSMQNISINNSPNSGGIYGSNHINDTALVQRMLE